MAKTTASKIRIRDPLSEVTRKERKALLAVSLLGLVIANTGMLPTEIDALGVKFSASDQKGILYVLVLVTAYFAIAFALYAASDFIAWRLALMSARQTAIIEEQIKIEHDRDDRDWDTHELAERVRAAMPRGVPWSRLSVPISVARVLFEFVLPLGFAFYAIVALLGTQFQLPPSPHRPMCSVCGLGLVEANPRFRRGSASLAPEVLLSK